MGDFFGWRKVEREAYLALRGEEEAGCVLREIPFFSKVRHLQSPVSAPAGS